MKRLDTTTIHHLTPLRHEGSIAVPIRGSSDALRPFSIVLPTACGGVNLTHMNLNQFPVAASSAGNKFDTQFLRKHFTKVVIQEMPTRRYWGSSGVWTFDIEKATIFRTCSAAHEEAMHLKLPNVQLVLIRELKEFEIIPLKASVRVAR